MTTVQQEDLIRSIADAFQFISWIRRSTAGWTPICRRRDDAQAGTPGA